MDRKKGAIRKTIIRNCEVPLKSADEGTNVVETFSALALRESNRERPPDKNHPDVLILKPTPPDTSRLLKVNPFKHDKYKIPQVNTSKKFINRIKKLETMNTRPKTKPDEMTPTSSKIVSQEITKKLNFPADRPIYKNLIPISVNNSLLIPPEQRKPFRTKYVVERMNDPVPELADFLEPIPPLQYTIPFKDTPPIRVKSDHNNYKSVYELHVNFHPDC